jgi:hypothetical protein
MRCAGICLGRRRLARDLQTPQTGCSNHAPELADYEWVAIKPMLPNKPRGGRRHFAHIPPATTDSSVGGELVSGAAHRKCTCRCP